MINSLWNNPPSRVWLVWEWLLDWNANDTSWNWNNWTATNVTYVKTYKWYQSQAGSFNGGNSRLSLWTTWIPTWNSNRTMCAWISWNKNNNTVIYSIWWSSTDNNMWISIHSDWQIKAYVYWRADLLSWVDKSWTHFVCATLNWTTLSVYVDWILKNTWTYSSVNITATNHEIWNLSLWHYYLWLIQWVRHYNRALSQEEIQTLYLEWQRLLWPTNIASYPKLFEWLVWYFENLTWTTELWNIATWIKSTYVWWTNTTDNLWINRAISNPNYTWTSITYTTWYTFENSGSGWQIVTSPTGLSTTWINRTTTLRNIFLFNRTLSSDEITTLQTLCNSDYIYPAPSYDLPNLRDWLVLDLNEQWQDLSWNWNHWTLVNSPTLVRQWKAKWLSYWSNQYINLWTWSQFAPTWSFTCWAWIKTTDNTTPVIMNKKVTNSYAWYYFHLTSWKIQFNIYDTTDRYSRSTETCNDWKYHLVIAVIDKTLNQIRLYLDWKECNYDVKQTTSFTMPSTDRPMYIWIAENISQVLWWAFSWNIVNPFMRNWVITSNEMMSMYYSQKWNFIY